MSLLDDHNLEPNDLDALARFRQDTPPMSSPARAQARRRLTDEINGSRARRPRSTAARRTTILAGAAAAIGLALVGSQLTGMVGTDSTAQAATVLAAAAAAIHPSSDSPPRKGQFVYLRSAHVDSTGGERDTVESWTPSDGSQPSLVRSRGVLFNDDHWLPPYQPGSSLYQAPYTVLAGLPTDPAALLKILYADPMVRVEMDKGRSRELATWTLLRHLVATVPPTRKAALFRAAAKIPGITYLNHATDADGRTGEAVGLFDPNLSGTINLIFDRQTHAFLGELVLSRGHQEFNSALEKTAVVDRVGQRPGE